VGLGAVVSKLAEIAVKVADDAIGALAVLATKAAPEVHDGLTNHLNKHSNIELGILSIGVVFIAISKLLIVFAEKKLRRSAGYIGIRPDRKNTPFRAFLSYR